MLTLEKDKLVDGYEFNKMTEEYKQKNQQQCTLEDITLTPKRRYDDIDNDIQEVENEEFQSIRRKNRKKTRQLLSSENQNIEMENINQMTSQGQPVRNRMQTERNNNIGRGMIIFNSHVKKNVHKKPNKISQQQVDDENIQHLIKNNITEQALHYAVIQQLPPIKINCQPPVKNHAEGNILIKALFSYIHDKFLKLNKNYTRPIGFDTWFIDQHGGLTCFTKEIELFVYLWDITHYSEKLLTTTITPLPPIHLPPQHSIIFKFVPTSISYDEMLEAVTDICQSKFFLEEMKGSISNKSRHIRLDLASKDETKKLLNSGVFPLNGQLLEIKEFLAPPQILICQRCNRPGRIKNNCNEPFDRCKRCGLNKLQDDHHNCTIKCHHCEGQHLSTDYRCPVIAKFRGDLIEELKRRPELLPSNTQLFIPVDFRNGGKKVINAARSNQDPLPTLLPTSNSIAWPVLNPSSSTTRENVTAMHHDMMQEIKTLRYDYEKLKNDFDRREAELKIKHENYKTKLSTMLNLLVLQNNQQNECISKVYTVVNETVPIITDSLKLIHTFIEKVVDITNDLNLKKEFNVF
ncbi:unnamed protein product [Rotaria sp. Silwood2]|nr:unnamed protein product [Rotaria sp. Silwood2]CAF4507937.1 unnamed protein product [Rotaria sp. Silwood2]